MTVQAAPARPNILLVTSDQQRGDCFGFEGRQVRTPHLDRMAAEGTRFAACITPNVVCMPARASILTGALPLTHGTHDNGIDLDEAVAERGFGGALSRAGYATAFIGKAHFSSNHSPQPTGRCENVPSSHRFANDWCGPYMGFEHVELVQLGHNYWLPEPPPGGMHYERWYHGDGLGAIKDALYRERQGPSTTAAQTHPSALPVAWHNSTWVADRSIELLRTHGRESRAAASAGRATKPFGAWVSFPDPHHPFDAPAPWSTLHDPADVDLPRHRGRDLGRRPWWHRAALENTPQGGDRKVREAYSRMPPQNDTQLRELIANYYGMVALIDHGVGRMLSVLHDEGLDRNTVVVFTSDHGDWLGDHGLVLKGPMFYEGLLRVGLVVRGPGVPAGKIVDEPVSTLDLAATFGDYAGVPVEAAVHSRSLRPLLDGDAEGEHAPDTPLANDHAAGKPDARDHAKGKAGARDHAAGKPDARDHAKGKADARDHALSEWRLGPTRCGVALDLRCVRTRTAKLTVELGSSAGELYDLADDPDECHNRFDDPAARGLRDELMDRLMTRPDDIRQPLAAPVGPA